MSADDDRIVEKAAEMMDLTIAGRRYVCADSGRWAVINPKDPNQVERLWETYNDLLGRPSKWSAVRAMSEALHEFANPTSRPTDAEARAMRIALARLDRKEGRA